jgi:hypothetical protein
MQIPCIIVYSNGLESKTRNWAHYTVEKINQSTYMLQHLHTQHCIGKRLVDLDSQILTTWVYDKEMDIAGSLQSIWNFQQST